MYRLVTPVTMPTRATTSATFIPLRHPSNRRGAGPLLCSRGFDTHATMPSQMKCVNARSGQDRARDPARAAGLVLRHPCPEIVEHRRGVGSERGAGERKRAGGEHLRPARRLVVGHLRREAGTEQVRSRRRPARWVVSHRSCDRSRCLQHRTCRRRGGLCARRSNDVHASGGESRAGDGCHRRYPGTEPRSARPRAGPGHAMLLLADPAVPSLFTRVKKFVGRGT